MLQPRVHTDEVEDRTDHTERAKKRSQPDLESVDDESAPNDRDDRRDWLVKPQPKTKGEAVRRLHNDPFATIPREQRWELARPTMQTWVAERSAEAVEDAHSMKHIATLVDADVAFVLVLIEGPFAF